MLKWHHGDARANPRLWIFSRTKDLWQAEQRSPPNTSTSYSLEPVNTLSNMENKGADGIEFPN